MGEQIGRERERRFTKIEERLKRLTSEMETLQRENDALRLREVRPDRGVPLGGDSMSLLRHG